MNLVGSALAVAGGTAVAGAMAALLVGGRARAVLGGAATAGVGVAGAVAGVSALGGETFSARFGDVLPLAGTTLAVDALSGWFMLLAGVVAVPVGVYATGYGYVAGSCGVAGSSEVAGSCGSRGRGGPAGRTDPAGHGGGAASRGAQALAPLFVFTLLLVPAAGSASTFLVAWELMASVSLLLVLAEHEHGLAVRSAGMWYAAMTHAGFIAILIGFVWFTADAGSDSFDALRASGAGLPAWVATGVFASTALGFVSKAGMVPLHVWLPRAHAEAPSHVSALMSAVMAALGVYGVLRVGVDLLGGGERWWWLVIAVGGALSALYGIMQAIVATDVKKLLAFSTTENIGVVMLGVGAGGMFAAAGQPGPAGLALAAALLHVLNHGVFKALLFLGAGSALRATGTRDLDALGGLSRRMPATTGMVALGALSAAALPLGAGFASEWLLLQSMMGSLPPADTLTSAVVGAAVAVIALTGGVGVAVYVNVLGTGFLARPRSAAAAAARESPLPMLVGMGLAAACCVVMGLAPGVVSEQLRQVVDGLGDRMWGAENGSGSGSASAVPLDAVAAGLRLTALSSTFSPFWVAAAVVAGTAGVSFAVRVAGRVRRTAARAWDCGDGPLTARMEYTATSFAEPLQRVFDDVLSPEQDVDVTHYRESVYLVERVRFHQQVPDRLEAHLYVPLRSAAAGWGRAGRRLADGDIHRYLAYTLAGVLLVLVVAVVA